MELYNNIYCQECNKLLGKNILSTIMSSLHSIDYQRKDAYFCDEKCYKNYKNRFEVDIYKDIPIYWIKDENQIGYIPYWESPYYFLTIEDCKEIIDMKYKEWEQFLYEK